MATAGEIAFGVIATFTTGPKVIGEITSMNGIELTADEVDITNHESTNRFKEVVQGLRDSGEFSVVGNHVPADAGQAQLYANYLAGVAEAITIVFPDESNWTANVFVKAYKPSDGPIEGKLEFSATLRVTGQAVFAAS